jgi:GT2 family glycosyltransferase
MKKNPISEPCALGFQPTRMLEVEISQPLPDISAFDSDKNQWYEHAISLVRLHRRPLGVVKLELKRDGIAATEYAHRIWEALRSDISTHLLQDGLPEVKELTEEGIITTQKPACQRERDAFLATSPFVSIVVATRDRSASLSACLDSLLSQDYPNYEIIIVDNVPNTNATFDLIKKKYSGLANVHYLRENIAGLSSAHNRGLMKVDGSIVAFTDDDVVVDEYWLTEIVRGFKVVDNVACVTGMIFPAELETPAQVWIEQFGGFSKGYKRRIFDLSNNRPESPLYPYNAGVFGSGANMAFKTSVLREIGGFDPALGIGSRGVGGDDLAAFFEVITRGYSLVYEPAAIVHHWHRRDYSMLRRQAYGYGVGLTAFLMKTLIDKPQRLFNLVVRIPPGLAFIFSSRSPKNIKKKTDYPKELTKIERKGMLYGPFAYLRSHRHIKKQYCNELEDQVKVS